MNRMINITPEVDGNYILRVDDEPPILRCFPDRGFAVAYLGEGLITDSGHPPGWLLSRYDTLVECAKVAESTLQKTT